MAKIRLNKSNRAAFAKAGIALPNGKFPIPDKAHLRAAVAYRHHTSEPYGKVEAHIRKRAKALGVSVSLSADIVEEFAVKGKYGRSTSLKWPWLYDKLRAKGYDKSKAAAISNSRLRFRKTGRLNVLQAEQAHNPKVLARVAKADKKGKHVTGKQLTSSAGDQGKRMTLSGGSRAYEFACHSAACAPPPAGTGGSRPGPGSRGSIHKVGMVESTKYPGNYHKIDEHGVVSEGMGSKANAEQWVKRRRALVKGMMTRDAANAKADKTAPEFRVITKEEARGDSRPVSHEEFQRLARKGQQQLDQFAKNSSPTTGLDRNWSAIKDEAWIEAQKSWGGTTIDAHTGEHLPQGADKYAITVKGGLDSVSVPETASFSEFKSAMDTAKQRFRGILERESHYLGVFHDDENHRIDIDPVLIVNTRAEVDTIGAASHSIGGAYNFKDGNGYWPPHVAG